MIYRQHGHVKEALEALNSPNLGTSSRIGKGNWVLVREKLDLLEEAEMWQEEWDYCRTLLDGAHSQNQTATNGADAEILTSQGDDWRLWTGLLTASQNLDTLTSAPS